METIIQQIAIKLVEELLKDVKKTNLNLNHLTERMLYLIALLSVNNRAYEKEKSGVNNTEDQDCKKIQQYF